MKQHLCFLLFSSLLQCFYIPKCHKDYAATHAIVQNISERLRSQHTVQCFVDPKDRTGSAIMTQIYGQVAVFHSLFWPSCTLIGGTIIIAMVKLTQYLSIMSERLNRIKTWTVGKSQLQKGSSLWMDTRDTWSVFSRLRLEDKEEGQRTCYPSVTAGGRWKVSETKNLKTALETNV